MEIKMGEGPYRKYWVLEPEKGEGIRLIYKAVAGVDSMAEAEKIALKCECPAIIAEVKAYTS